MADNVTLPGTGSVVRAKDKGGAESQVVLLDLGGAGAENLATGGQQAAAGSLPVVIALDQSAVPVSAASLPLPTGAATDAKQDAANTSLASIDAKVAACNTGAVVVSACALPSGAATEATLATLNGKVPALGQALAAASVPVVLTAVQLSTLTPPAAITGYATETTLATLNTGSNFDAKTGSLTETAPATDTASSGLNGRLQRLAQRFTSLIGLLPSALTGSGNLKVAVQESLPAGTAAIGKLAANDGVDIGDVTINNASIAVTGTFWQSIQPVSGTITANQGGTWTAATNADGTTGSAVPSKGLLVQGSDGTNARNLATTTGGVLKVDLSATTGNATAVKVDGSAAAQPVTDNSGSLTVDAPVGTPVFVRLSDGSAAIATLPVSIADGVNTTFGAKADAKSTATDTTAVSAMSVLKQISASVQAPPSQAVTNTGTFAVQAAGDVAHGATNSGNPLQNGCEAIAHGTNPTAVTAGQRTKNYANRAGIPFVMGGHPNVQTVRLQFTTAQTDIAIVTVSTGTKIVVTALQVTLDNASTVFPSVRIGFGTANTPTTTGVIAAHGGVPAGGGFSRGDGSGIIGIGADNEDLRITTVGTATGNGVEVVVTYYTIES